MAVETVRSTDVITSAADLPPPFVAAYEYWRGLTSAGQRFPARRDFQLDRLDTRIIPWSVLVDVRNDPFDLVYRFWGTERAYLIGVELTGKSVHDIPTAYMREANISEYREVLASRQPLLCKTPVATKTGRQAVFQSIRLPLTDHTGAVSGIYSAMNYQQISDASYEFFGTLSAGDQKLF